ncbi:MAG: hypothetical protein ACLRPV_11185 [Lacrimispora saccharolytica]
MKYINELREGSRMSGIYLCRHRQAAVTRNGKPYENVILQDRTGTIDAKISEPNSPGGSMNLTCLIMWISSETSLLLAAPAFSIKRVRKAQENTIRQTIFPPAGMILSKCIRSF